MNGDYCLSFVFLGHLNLIITRESIHKGEEHVGSSIIDQCIDMRQWEIVLGASLVQIVGKFRLRLIELTSLKPKLLIRFIMNKPC